MFKANSSSRRRLRVAAGLGAAAASLAFTGIASAAVQVIQPDEGIGVSCPNSASSSNLTTAILNATAATNTIVLTPGTYCPVLPNGASTLSITHNLSIVTDHSYQSTGGLPNIEVAGYDSANGFTLTVAAGTNLTLEGFDLNASGGNNGNVVNVNGSLTTWGMTFDGNYATPVSVARGGTASLNDTTISDSLSQGLINNGTTTLDNDSIVNGGSLGIQFGSGSVTAYNTLIANNNGTCNGKFANNPAPGTLDDGASASATCGGQYSGNSDIDNWLGGINPPTQGVDNTNGGPASSTALDINPDTSLKGVSAYCPLTDGRFFVNPIIAGKVSCDIGAVTYEADATTGAPDANSATQETSAPTCTVTGGVPALSQQVTLADAGSGIGPELGLLTDNPTNTPVTTYSNPAPAVPVAGYAVDNLVITNGSVSLTSPTAPQPSLVLTAGNKTTAGVNNSQWSFTGLNWAGVAKFCA